MSSLVFPAPRRLWARAYPIARMGNSAHAFAQLAPIALPGCAAFLIAMLVSFYVQPAMRIHDEFSYRLAADTLLHGRLSNPTPPAWEALQSFHVIMQPSYCSKYPLGASILGAFGWLAFGTPLAGSWIAAGLLAAATVWMVAGVLPRRWAMLGGCIIALHPFLQLAWSQSLMNGTMVAAGSALLTGGVLRLRRRVALQPALISGLGIATLAITRPFEGLVCTVICSALLWFGWSRVALRVRCEHAVRTMLYACAPISAAVVLIAAQNQAACGAWWKMPYQLHEQQYGVAPIFVFQSLNTANMDRRADRPELFHTFHAEESRTCYQRRLGWIGLQNGWNDAASALFTLAFPFAFGILVSGTRWIRFRLAKFLLVAIALQTTVSLSVVWIYAHYLAPVVPWLLLLTLIALRTALIAARTSPLRTSLVTLTIAVVLVVQLGTLVTYASVARERELHSWARKRQSIADQLLACGGRHLIFVRYGEKHNVHEEWVYNDAEPLESPIVWARYEDGRWLDQVLTHYGTEREVWMLDADSSDPELQRLSLRR